MGIRTFTDQMGCEVTVSFPPQKIISLVPSQTELLASLGLNTEVRGITKFCAHPEAWRKSKKIIGGTKQFRFDVIDTINPNLIIGNKEENYQEGIEILRKRYPVWMSDIVTHQDALDMINGVGALVAKEAEAINLADEIQRAFNNMVKVPVPDVRTLYLIWRNPWMGVAAETFIHEMLDLAGFQNCLQEQIRYPELALEQINELDPQVVLLSSEPYPFSEKHIHELKTILPDAKIVPVDGEMFSWYGSRMLYFPDYINRLRTLLT